MEAAASKTCGIDISEAHHKVIHRWMFASVSKPSSEGYFYDRSLKIATCGDWCNGGRVEGAYISGLMVAKIIEGVV
jgi:predicted NAD/FAD-dependent oxidoreductase